MLLPETFCDTYNGTMQATRKRMGRPPSASKAEHMVHVRLTDELKSDLERIRDERLDRPGLSALIREALAAFVTSSRKQGGKG